MLFGATFGVVFIASSLHMTELELERYFGVQTSEDGKL